MFHKCKFKSNYKELQIAGRLWRSSKLMQICQNKLFWKKIVGFSRKIVRQQDLVLADCVVILCEFESLCYTGGSVSQAVMCAILRQ